MPLVSDFLDVLQEMANADLAPVTHLRAKVPTLRLGRPTPGSAGYDDLGALPEDATVVVPVELESYAERNRLQPGGDRASARIVVYTPTLIRASRNPDAGADVVVTADGRRWRAVHVEDWSASGNFYAAECELIDENTA